MFDPQHYPVLGVGLVEFVQVVHTFELFVYQSVVAHPALLVQGEVLFLLLETQLGQYFFLDGLEGLIADLELEPFSVVEFYSDH